MRRATRTYEAKTTTAEHSYLQFVGYTDDGMYSRVDLPKLGTRLAVPVFLLQDAQDLVTTADVSRRYFDAI